MRDGEQKRQNIVQNYDLEWHADSMGFLVGPEQSQESQESWAVEAIRSVSRALTANS